MASIHPSLSKRKATTMFKKCVIGLLAVAIFGSIAYSGYEFGKYMAERESANNADVKSEKNTSG